MVGSVEDFCERVRRGLADATFEQRRRLVELLIDRVIVTDEEVEIRYVIPTDPSSEHIRFCHLRSDYLYNPASRQNRESPRWQKLSASPPPSHLRLPTVLRPRHQHLLGSRLARSPNDFYRPPKRLFHPVAAFILTAV